MLSIVSYGGSCFGQLQLGIKPGCLSAQLDYVASYEVPIRLSTESFSVGGLKNLELSLGLKPTKSQLKNQKIVCNPRRYAARFSDSGPVGGLTLEAKIKMGATVRFAICH